MKVVIVGGGFGGVKAAQELSKSPSIDVMLISKSVNFEYHAALYRSATGKSPREVIIPLKSIFADTHNVEVEQAEITRLEVQHKRVISETNDQYNYDLLILALGQEINYYGIEGLEKNCHSLDTISNTIALREHLRQVIEDDFIKAPHFAVIGGGASGVELAAEISNFVKVFAEEKNLPSQPVKVSLIEGSDRVLPALNPKLSRKAQKRLSDLGVEVLLNQKVMAATANSVALESGDLKVDSIIWTAGNRNNHFFRNHEHLFEFAKNTRVIVSDRLESRDSVYVIGDSADSLYSGMAQTALHQATYVADDIIRRLNNKDRVAYKPKMPIYVVPVGQRFAVFQSKTFRLYGYPAWLMRRAADFRLFTMFEPLREAVKSWRKGNQRATNY